MKNTTQSIIGWCAGLAIGMTIGVSQNNIILGIGLGVAFGKFQLADKENEDGTTKVRYEYDMIDIPPDMEGKTFSDHEGEMLEMVLGQVYLNILNEELEHQKEVNEDGTHRKYDFTKPTL